MGLKGFITAAAAVALMVTPTMSVAAPSVVPVSSEIRPASESVDGMAFGGRGVLVIGAIILLGLGAWLIFGHDGKDEPVSP